MPQFTEHNGFALEYETFGTGDLPMLAFHGFDRNFNDFRVLLPSLGQRYTIYSFNIFFHGASRAANTRAILTESDLKGLVQAVMEKHGFTDFAVMGYSLGGKIALKLVELMPAKINDALLMAPEGLRVNMLYRLISETAWGLGLYRLLMRVPVFIYLVVYVARALRFINEKQHRFVHNSINSPAKRMKVWRIWHIFSKLPLNQEKLRLAFRKNSIQAHFFFGQYDRIIPASIGEDFVHKLSDNCHLHILEMNHQFINDRLNGVINEVLV